MCRATLAPVACAEACCVASCGLPSRACFHSCGRTCSAERELDACGVARVLTEISVLGGMSVSPVGSFAGLLPADNGGVAGRATGA